MSHHQSRPSTYEQRHKFNLLTADDIYGPGDEPDEPEELSAEEQAELEQHGLYNMVSHTKYGEIKKDLDYPVHLRFPDGKNPCWAFHNNGACTADNCPFSHDRDRNENYIRIRKLRVAFQETK